MSGKLIIRIKRHAAAVAHFELGWNQTLSYRHAMIKDKAFALPLALLFRHLLKIFENAALQMINFAEALVPQVA